jgi:hypothetical protein
MKTVEPVPAATLQPSHVGLALESFLVLVLVLVLALEHQLDGQFLAQEAHMEMVAVPGFVPDDA